MSVEAKEKGLHLASSYAITRVLELRAKHVNVGIPLIKLLNPRGDNKEWTGDWSDG